MLTSTQSLCLVPDVSCFCRSVGDKTVPSGDTCRKKSSLVLRFFARAFTQSCGDTGVRRCGWRTFVLEPSSLASALRLSVCLPSILFLAGASLSQIRESSLCFRPGTAHTRVTPFCSPPGSRGTPGCSPMRLTSTVRSELAIELEGPYRPPPSRRGILQISSSN